MFFIMQATDKLSRDVAIQDTQLTFKYIVARITFGKVCKG